MRKHASGIALILLLAYVQFVVGCTYYKVTNTESIASIASEIQNNARYFIVHQGSNAWHFTNIALDSDKEQLTGTLEALPENHHYYLTTKPVGPNRILKSTGAGTDQQVARNSPTYEVHFYVSEYLENHISIITIPLANISKIEIYDKDVSANTASGIFTALGVVAGIIVIVGVIVALTKSSCPFVYAYDGTSWEFAGEMYGGAIYSSLERHDFMPLPGIKASNGQYHLQISNKLLERQYTNLAELVVVEHPFGTKACTDRNGNIMTILSPQSPVLAISEKNIEHTSSIASKDSSAYLFNDENRTNPDLSSLTLTFRKPANPTIGKLVVNIKNSYWLDYVYGKFNEQFGTYFNAFSAAQKHVPPERINQWTMDQSIPLSVYVQTDLGWEYMDYFQVTGPLASREIGMKIDLSKVTGDQVRIRLVSGFMFWELDYAALDFSEDIPVQVSHLEAISAIDDKGLDVATMLVSDDDAYLVQPEVGNEVNLSYVSCPPQEQILQTVFLHSKGYYEYIRDYKNVPDLIALSGFKKKGSFTRFSKKKYNEFISKPYLFDDAITTSYGN
jgi:hypothetical protein